MRYGVYYYDGPNGQRAKITDLPGKYSRLVIRADHGQGDVVLQKKYKNHIGARAALRRLGFAGWYYKRVRH